MVRLRSGLAIVEVEDGKILLDTKRGVYWHLNLTAIALLDELSRGRTFDDHISQMARDTGMDEARVRSDHLALVQELRQAKLVEGGLT